MYLCLSSASRAGYSKDVVDTLAAPMGGERQFRYDQKWVEPAIRQLADQGKVPANAKCLLCFIDLRGNPKDPFILPLREATLTQVIPVGSTYTLVFRLGAFRRPSDMRQFSKVARKEFPELHRIEAVQGKREPKGFLWIDAKNQLDSKLKSVVTDGNWALEWEQIVCDYLNVMNSPEQFSTEFYDKDALTSAEGKFKDQSPFYVFYDLKSVPDGKRVKSETKENRSAFQLAPDSTYELLFYHYHPSKAFPDVRLSLSTTHDGAKIVSNESHAFNTRYDVKRFTLSTTSVLSGASGNILVSRIFADGASATSVGDIYLHYGVASSKGKMALYILGIAAAFAIPQLMILWNSTPAAGPAQYIIVVVAALTLGTLAIFKDLLKLK
jgi:hypothetical protein